MGSLGGASGAGPDVELTFPDGRKQHLLKVNAMQIPAGTIVRIMICGGGGLVPRSSDPWNSSETMCAMVTLVRGAGDEFGVVLGDGGDVVLEATAKAERPGQEGQCSPPSLAYRDDIRRSVS